MCDTIVVLGSATKQGDSFFAKNSDREPNEAQYLMMIPARDYAEGDTLRCTYVEIPQVRHTFQVLLSKPFWMWGAEMGANECGVVIGNEAIFTRLPARREPGLIGMDFLRLALERAATAKDALETIAKLVEDYGQSGNCGMEHGLYYNNSFLIMDPNEAYVLETVDKMWIAKKVSDYYAISNAPSITTEWDFISDGLIDYACEKKWCKDKKTFNFAEAYADLLFTKFSQGRERRACVLDALAKKEGSIDLQFMKSILRSHGLNPQKTFPDRSLTAWNVCMHAAPGPIRNSQSVGSLISQFTKDDIVHWVTGTSAPCFSVFKPVWMKAGLPDIGPELDGCYRADSLWWQHEVVHRAALKDFHTIQPELADRIQTMEQMIDDLVLKQLDKVEVEQRVISQTAFRMEREAYRDWLKMIRDMETNHHNALYYHQYWRNRNRKVALPV